MLTAEFVRSMLRYDAESGLLYWLPRPVDMFTQTAQGQSAEARCRAWNKAQAGKVAFTAKNFEGYYCGTIMGVGYRAQRVAWLIHYGEWPSGVVDHINGDRGDNRIANLRDVSVSENGRNTALSVRNKSGVKGVHFSTREGLFRAQITVGGKVIGLGYFASLDDAARVRAAAEDQHGFIRRETQRARDQRAMARQSRQDHVPGMQSHAAQEARPMPQRQSDR
jgi:hypothetical protein